MGDSLVVVTSGARVDLAVKPEKLPLAAGPFEPLAAPDGVAVLVGHFSHASALGLRHW